MVQVVLFALPTAHCASVHPCTPFKYTAQETTPREANPQQQRRNILLMGATRNSRRNDMDNCQHIITALPQDE